MLSKILNLSFFTLLPLSVLAANHGQLLHRRHADLAKRSEFNATNETLVHRAPNARWSYYDVQTGNAGSCGSFHVNSDFTVALSATQMNPSLCYKKIVMTYNGKTTYADISDTCPGCPWNGLDLTEGLFAFFAPMSAGIIYGDWEYADAAPAAPAPQPTTTWKPSPTPTPTPTPQAPKPTTTWVPPTTTTTSSKPPPPSSKASSASRSSSINYSSGVASGLAVPTGNPKGSYDSSNLALVDQAFVQFGGLIVAGNRV